MKEKRIFAQKYIKISQKSTYRKHLLTKICIVIYVLYGKKVIVL